MEFFVQTKSGSTYLISTDSQYGWVIKTHNGDRVITALSDPDRGELIPLHKIKNPHQFQYRRIHYAENRGDEVHIGKTTRVEQLMPLPDPKETSKDNEAVK
jgi:hypothetical protein